MTGHVRNHAPSIECLCRDCAAWVMRHASRQVTLDYARRLCTQLEAMTRTHDSEYQRQGLRAL